MSSLPIQRFSPEEYLAIDRAAERRSEYFNGEILAMAGASREHILMVTNVIREFDTRLRGTACETYSNDLRVRSLPSRYIFPDVVVACEPEFADASLDILLNPRVVIEVLSPSTERNDRGWKFESYRGMPSMADYLMLSQERPYAEHFTRFNQDLWTLQEYDELESVIPLTSIGCELRLADVYERITFPEELRLSGEEE